MIKLGVWILMMVADAVAIFLINKPFHDFISDSMLCCCVFYVEGLLVGSHLSDCPPPEEHVRCKFNHAKKCYANSQCEI